MQVIPDTKNRLNATYSELLSLIVRYLNYINLLIIDRLQVSNIRNDEFLLARRKFALETRVSPQHKIGRML